MGRFGLAPLAWLLASAPLAAQQTPLPFPAGSTRLAPVVLTHPRPDLPVTEFAADGLLVTPTAGGRWLLRSGTTTLKDFGTRDRDAADALRSPPRVARQPTRRHRRGDAAV